MDMINATVIGTISFNDAEIKDGKNGSKIVKFSLQQKTSHKETNEDGTEGKYYVKNNYYVTYFCSEKMLWCTKGLVKGATVAIIAEDIVFGVGKTGKPYATVTARAINVISSSDAPTNVGKTATKPDYNKAEETDEESPF